MSKSKIVFVDGPSGIGKGYFIENLAKLYKSKRPDATVHSLRLSDLTLTGIAASEERKATVYNTPIDKVESIYVQHLLSLEKMKKLVSDFTHEDDLLIVDRSFSSFFVYNWSVLNDSLLNHKGETVDRLKACSVSHYAEEFKRVLNGIPTVYVGLTMFAMSDIATTSLLVQRLKKRSPENPVHPEWILQLVRSYNELQKELFEMYDKVVVTESGNSASVGHQLT